MKVNRLGVILAKHYMRISDKKMRKEFPAVDLSHAKLDIAPFDGANFDQCYDIYYAENPNGITLIDIHGGAYIYSNRKNNAYFAEFFTKKGFNVAVLDYRLNHGHIDPHDQILDLVKEISHLYQHAEELGINPNAIALMGDSAGGHFAFMVAALMDDPKLANKLGYDLGGCKATCVALNCPVYDLVAIGKGDAMTNGAKKYMLGKRALDYDYIGLVSPKANLNSIKMPIFLSTCKNDFIRGESIAMKHDLDERGYPHVFMDIQADDVQHVHNVTLPYNESSVQVNEAMVDFFLSHCKTK